jgi:putative ribosome biogenesis GTPase RsgA
MVEASNPPQKKIIFILGETGAGKSAFINSIAD